MVRKRTPVRDRVVGNRCTSVHNDRLIKAMRRKRDDNRRLFQKLYITALPRESFPAVADVGGGTGWLSEALEQHGYKATLVDPRPFEVKAGVDVWRRRFLVKHGLCFDALAGYACCAASPKFIRACRHAPGLLYPCKCTWFWPRTSAGHARPADRSVRMYAADHGVRCEQFGPFFLLGPTSSVP